MMDGSELRAPPQYFEGLSEDVSAGDALREQLSLDSRLAALRTIKVKRRLFGIALVASDIFACTLAVAASQLAYDGGIDLEVAAAVVAGGFPVYFLAALQTGAHNPAVARRVSDSVKSAALALFITAAIFFFGLFAAKVGGSVSRLQVGQTLLFTLLLGTMGRYAIAKRSARLFGPQPFADLCIYDDVPFRANRGGGAIRAVDAGLDPTKIARPEMVARLGELCRSMDRIVIHCSPARREAWTLALRCVDIRSEIVMPELKGLMPLELRNRNGEVSVVLANGPLRWHQRWTKNLFDRIVGTIALVALLPVMALIALAVKLDSPGPVFFRQDRIGLGNRRFHIWKFRTMRSDQLDPAALHLTEREDPRVTRLGRFLRRTSLDELPQFLNVVLGQMSLVGPRPHAIESRAGRSLYWEVDSAYWFRHTLRPGITGLAQIRGLRGSTFEEDDLRNRLQSDLDYVANWSLVGDIRILFQTASVICHRNAF